MRREEIEALAAVHDTLSKRRSTWRSGDAAQDRAYNAGRREAHEDAARMLREALAKSEAGSKAEPGQKTMTLAVEDVLAWEDGYMSEGREIPAMGPGLWMVIEIGYDYSAGYADVTAYPKVAP